MAATEVETPPVFNLMAAIPDTRLQLLQELLNVTSHDIGKLDVSEIVLRYFERQRKRDRVVAGNPWQQADPAIRHLQISSQGSCRQVYLTRGRVGAGGDREITAAALVARARAKREKREKKLKELAAKEVATAEKERAEKDKAKATEEKKGETPGAQPEAAAAERELSAVAQTLVNGALDVAQIEREVSEIATQMTWNAVNTACVENELQAYVAELISTAIARAKATLENEPEAEAQVGSEAPVDSDTQTRIEQVAQEIVRDVIEQAQLAYMRERSQ